MGRKEKNEDREQAQDHSSSGRDSRKRRQKASRSRSRSASRERDASKAKKVKSEKDVHVKSERETHAKEERDRHRDIKERERPKRGKDAHLPQEEPDQGDAAPTASSTNETSISIEETNRIRAELGLKPLAVGGEGGEESKEKKDVHVPAENLGELKKTQEIRRKLEERKEKRKIEQRLAKVRTIAETADEEDDSAASWIEKSRKLQQAKEEAAKRAKMLDEADEAFGVGDMVTSEVTKQRAKAYTAKDLRGLTVEHDRDSIAEGKSVVLTLKDQNILDAESDVLVNVNMVDEERYRKNNEIKKQKPGYVPYEEDEVDEFGLPKNKSLLAKYDSEIDGDKRDSFVLGKEEEEIAKLRMKESLKEKLKEQQKRAESLEMRPMRMASEYMTHEEMATFKKPKRRVKKIRKSDQILKADDLLKDFDAESTNADLGSRSKRIKADPDGPTDDLSHVRITTDDTPVEVRQAQEKMKRFKRRVEKWDTEDIAKMIKPEPMDEPMDIDVSKNSHIVLNATAEFCRTLGDIPTYGMAGNRDEDEEELLDFERQLAEDRRKKLEKEERKKETERLQERGGWNVLDGDGNQGSDEDMDLDHGKNDAGTVILDEEPNVSVGMGAALKLAMSKGYLEKEEKKRVVLSKAAQELQAQRYSIEDKSAEDDKYSRRNRFDGPVTEFKEKEGYKPAPKLEYIDDNGKAMSTKEAFRHLSHKFHGKGSGKLKCEKRSKKQEDKMLLDRMSSTDTPLNTLKKLQDKQKELQSPYVVLSGKLAPTSIVKPSKGKK